MPAITFSSSGRPDKTFAIAIAAAAIVGVAELVAVGWHYNARSRAARQAATPVATATQLEVAAPATSQAVAPVAPAAPATSSAVLSATETLLQEATALRERGDTTNALARLQDAAQREPKNAKVLAEMALTYESMQLLDRSNETWRKIQELGPSAGPLFELADMKLKVGVAPASPSAASAGPGFAGVSPLDAGTTRNNPEGIPDASTFGITEAAVTDNPDPEAEANKTLRVGVKVRSSTVIDHTKVKIQVYFYDIVEKDKMALTDAEVNYEWITPNHDWKGTNTETLAVSYVRLKAGGLTSEAALTEAAAAVRPPVAGRKTPATKKPTSEAGNRTYGGYQVRVYYNDQLQDVRAEPTKLLNLYPPPLSLTSP